MCCRPYVPRKSVHLSMRSFIRSLSLLQKMYALATLLCLVLALVPQDAIEISTHDSYFIVHAFFIWIMLAGFYFFFFGVHWLLGHYGRSIHRVILWIHLVVTLLFTLGNMYLIQTPATSEQFTDYNVYDEVNSYVRMVDYYVYFTVFFLVVLKVQVLWLIGFLVASMGKRR